MSVSVDMTTLSDNSGHRIVRVLNVSVEVATLTACQCDGSDTDRVRR